MINYYSETDTLYINVSNEVSVESEEICENVVVDYGENGNIVGIEIDNISRKLKTSLNF